MESPCLDSPLAAAQRRVGEDEVDGRLGNEGKDFKTVALVEAKVMFGVVEDSGGEKCGKSGHRKWEQTKSTARIGCATGLIDRDR